VAVEGVAVRTTLVHATCENERALTFVKAATVAGRSEGYSERARRGVSPEGFT
jgi:hypothetical protein